MAIATIIIATSTTRLSLTFRIHQTEPGKRTENRSIFFVTRSTPSTTAFPTLSLSFTLSFPRFPLYVHRRIVENICGNLSMLAALSNVLPRPKHEPSLKHLRRQFREAVLRRSWTATWRRTEGRARLRRSCRCRHQPGESIVEIFNATAGLFPRGNFMPHEIARELYIFVSLSLFSPQPHSPLVVVNRVTKGIGFIQRLSVSECTGDPFNCPLPVAVQLQASA